GAEAPILAMLLPSSSAPISRSRMPNRLETTSASLLPCFDSRSMLAREAPVSAVSLAAKNADVQSSATMMENVSQSMTWASLHLEQYGSGKPGSSFFRITQVRPALLSGNREPAPARHPSISPPAPPPPTG